MQEVDTLLQDLKPFDVAMNIFTSIGYGSEDQDETFFSKMRKIVKDVVTLLMTSLNNRDFMISHFAQGLHTETDKLVVPHKNEFDMNHSRLSSNWRFYLKKNGSLEFGTEMPIHLRVYSPHEVVLMLERTGWKVLGLWDDIRLKNRPTIMNLYFSVVAEAV